MKKSLRQTAKSAMLGAMALLFGGSVASVSGADNNKDVAVSNVAMHADVWPAMIRRADNPVIRLDIELPAGSSVRRLERVDVDLTGTGKKTVESLDILKGKEDEMSGFDKSSGKSARRIPASMKVEIPAGVELAAGKNYVWINAHLAKGAVVGDSLVVKPLKVQVDGKTYEVEQPRAVTQRVGYVLAQDGDKVKPSGRVSHFFRIPGLVRTKKGTLLASLDIRYDRKNDLPSDIDVGIARSTDGGKTWSPVSVAMVSKAAIPGIAGTGAGDPCILVDNKTGRVWIAALWANGVNPIFGPQGTNDPAGKSGQFLVCYSDDDGLTWSKPANITEQVKRPEWATNFQGPGAGICMKNGVLVFPCQFWFDENGARKAHASIVYSKDGGKTWKCGQPSSSGTSESQVVELSDGSLMLNSRNENKTGYRVVSITKDLGETWEPHPASNNQNGKGLVEPWQACQASIIAIPGIKGDKRPFVFSNPQLHDKDRRQMMIRTSFDDGNTWLNDKALLYDARYGYGYSSIAPAGGEYLGVLYEGRGVLFFLRIPYAELFGGK